MALTEDLYLPSYEELTVPELPVTSGVLRAASLYLGKYCDEPSKEFMLCKSESNNDPRQCVNEGKQVTRCGFEFLGKVKANCYEEFNKYSYCVDHSVSLKFKDCRKPQALFDSCIGAKMNIDRPEPGYFSMKRAHETTREKTGLLPLVLPEGPKPIKTGKTEPDGRPGRHQFGTP